MEGQKWENIKFRQFMANRKHRESANQYKNTIFYYSDKNSSKMSKIKKDKEAKVCIKWLKKATVNEWVNI